MEPDCVQVTQQGVHRRRPRPGGLAGWRTVSPMRTTPLLMFLSRRGNSLPLTGPPSEMQELTSSPDQIRIRDPFRHTA
jgi:hypothetical protein